MNDKLLDDDYLEKLHVRSENGDKDSMFELGLYYYDKFDGNEALLWLTRASELGHKGAYHLINDMKDEAYELCFN
jgi:TPR repeat protein